jgi:hypothetical protein
MEALLRLSVLPRHHHRDETPVASVVRISIVLLTAAPKLSKFFPGTRTLCGKPFFKNHLIN